MAIQVRRGLKALFDKNKMLPGELATTLDEKGLYAAFAPGDVKKIATYEDMTVDIQAATQDIIDELTVEIDVATKAAQTAATGVESAIVQMEATQEIADNIVATVTQANASVVDAENIRVSSENTRKSNETDRVANESARQNYYNAYKVLEAYSGTKAYVIGNKVTYNGSTYQCITGCSGILPTNTANWILIAQRGSDGSGTGDMLKSVYDTTGKNTDVFNYIGDKTTLPTTDKSSIVASINEVSSHLGDKANVTSLTAHTGDSTIHITGTERTTWNAKVNATDTSAIAGKIYAYRNIGGSL